MSAEKDLIIYYDHPFHFFKLGMRFKNLFGWSFVTQESKAGVS